MNEALEIYKNEDKVYSVTGYSFTDNILDIESSYFLKLTSSWSWGTWADRWQQFKRDKKDLEQIISSSKQEKIFLTSMILMIMSAWLRRRSMVK